MSNVYGIIGITAALLSFLGYIPYIIGTIYGKTRPNQATWIIWTLVGGLLAFTYIAVGDKNAIWLPISYFVGPFFIAILTFFYGYYKWTKLDTICIVAAFISIIPWILSDKPMLTLLINVFIDSIGALPTLVKTFRDPDSEDFSAWLLFFLANTLEIFAISNWNLSAAYPIYLFVLGGLMVFFILKDKIVKAILES